MGAKGEKTQHKKPDRAGKISALPRGSLSLLAHSPIISKRNANKKDCAQADLMTGRSYQKVRATAFYT